MPFQNDLHLESWVLEHTPRKGNSANNYLLWAYKVLNIKTVNLGLSRTSYNFMVVFIWIPLSHTSTSALNQRLRAWFRFPIPPSQEPCTRGTPLHVATIPQFTLDFTPMLDSTRMWQHVCATDTSQWPSHFLNVSKWLECTPCGTNGNKAMWSPSHLQQWNFAATNLTVRIHGAWARYLQTNGARLTWGVESQNHWC